MVEIVYTLTVETNEGQIASVSWDQLKALFEKTIRELNMGCQDAIIRTKTLEQQA